MGILELFALCAIGVSMHFAYGGGIRGYSSLLILKFLVHEIVACEARLQKEEGPVVEGEQQTFDENTLLLCHYFDFMYGTSTGGLISVLLGRLRMTIPECLDIYREVGNDLFGHRRNVLPLATKYHHKPLEKAVRRIVRKNCKHHDKCDGEDWHPWSDNEQSESSSSLPEEETLSEEEEHEEQEDEDMVPQTDSKRICQTICLTATHSGQIDEAYLLRTYDHQYSDSTPEWVTPYNEGADHLKIWQVTRATSAAPFFFKMLEAELHGRKIGFKDGGIRENNPSYAAYSEHASLRGEDQMPGLLLSVGTGRPDHTQDGFASAWPGPFGMRKFTKKWAEKFAVFKNVLIKYTEGEERHKMMRTIAKGEHHWYKRLNVTTGLENMKLDNWEKGPRYDARTKKMEVVPGGKTLSWMEKVTDDYLTREKVDKEYAAPKVMLAQTAEKLVRHRRARERTRAEEPERWESFMGRRLPVPEGSEVVPVER
ncbi:FabD/lysophospholipase-like protein [Lophium mytilinum]|uniref:FabD/lysophospholipase-like protein n=1 Tax=Lophium mytilinum TaxID=390894 RepID=A0A6A6QSB9_9PEZI|nr:FabD/lysophospholipase-like protein [Lophium mytilinum]